MTWTTLLALLLPAAVRSDAHAELTRAVAANMNRRRASVPTALVADSRAANLDATIRRIEGRSGDRLADHPRVGEAAFKVAEATREFLRKSR